MAEPCAECAPKIQMQLLDASLGKRSGKAPGQKTRPSRANQGPDPHPASQKANRLNGSRQGGQRAQEVVGQEKPLQEPRNGPVLGPSREALARGGFQAGPNRPSLGTVRSLAGSPRGGSFGGFARPAPSPRRRKPPAAPAEAGRAWGSYLLQLGAVPRTGTPLVLPTPLQPAAVKEFQ